MRTTENTVAAPGWISSASFPQQSQTTRLCEEANSHRQCCAVITALRQHKRLRLRTEAKQKCKVVAWLGKCLVVWKNLEAPPLNQQKMKISLIMSK